MRFASVLRAHRLPIENPRTEPRDLARLDTSVRAVFPLYPRGPRSGPGYSVPVHPHLIDPIRPTRRHTRLRRFAAYTRCLRCASVLGLQCLGDPRVVPCFRWHSVSTCCPLGSREAHRLLAPSSFTNDAGLRPKRRVSALPISHTPILVRGFISGLTYGSLSLRPVDLLAPLLGADQVFTQPTGAFTSGLSTDWSPAPSPDITTEVTGQAPLAGLSPARTPTSIAATARRTGQADFPHPALGKDTRCSV